MRITFVLPTANMSGGVRVVAIYAQAMMQLGHDVCVVSTKPATLSFQDKLKSWFAGEGWPDVRSWRKSHLDSIGLDHRIIDHSGPPVDEDVPDADVVIATWWETAEMVATLSARKGVKVYFIQHHEIHHYLPVARIRATYRLPFHKIVIARWLQRVMGEQYGDYAVDVVPNSVDRKQFFAPVRGKQLVPTVGFLYSTTPFKGVETTLATLRLVRERVPNLQTVSFGLHHPTSRLPLPVGTKFRHMPPQDEIRNLYACCDVWLTASRSEGFNLPALEAMACRTPIVSTKTGWPEEAIKSGENGVLADVEDIRGLAEGVEWVLSRSDEEWRSLSKSAYSTAAAGSWQESAKMFESALQRACRRATHREIEGRYSTRHESLTTQVHARATDH